MVQKDKEDKAVEEELAVYEKLRQRLSKALGTLNDRITATSVGQALEKATTDLKEMGEHSREMIGRTADTLKKDIVSSVNLIKPQVKADIKETKGDFTRLHNKGGALWRELSNEAEYLKKLSRDKSGAFLLAVTRGLSDWSTNLSDRLDTSLTYKTGEISHGGYFTCSNCGAEIHLKKPGHLPPCPKCSKTEFRRA